MFITKDTTTTKALIERNIYLQITQLIPKIRNANKYTYY